MTHNTTQSRCDTKQHALVITGMHRSGTSLIASLMESAGLFIGHRLLPGGRGNEAGHFEDLDFYDFHQRALLACGLDKDGYVKTADIDLPTQLELQAREIITAREGLGRPWGWKDPRTVLFLDHWRRLMPESCNLFVFRAPWEVVDSLYRRSDTLFGVNPQLALDTWHHYNSRIKDFILRYPDSSLLCELQQVIADPQGLVTAVAQRFGIALTAPQPRYREELLAHSTESFRITAIRQLAPHCMRLYADLLDLAGAPPYGQEPPDTVKTSHLPHTHELISGILTDWSQIRHQQAAIEQAQTERDHLATNLESVERDKIACVDAQQAHIARLEQRVGDLESTLAAVRQAAERYHASLANAHRMEIAELAQHSRTIEADLLEAIHVAEGEKIASAAKHAAKMTTLEQRAGDLESTPAETEPNTAQAATRREERDNAHAAAPERHCVDLETVIAVKEREYRALDAEHEKLSRLHKEVLASNSWRLTRPLRGLRRITLTQPYACFRRWSSTVGKAGWRRLPVSGPTKYRIRQFLFTRMPWLFRGTRSYQEWQSLHGALRMSMDADHRTLGLKAPSRPPAEDGVRVIAMHLPQFHCIPENDASWGEGFTEWTNVRRGLPMYDGHYQPHVPHPDIGYYDLSDACVLEHQAAMAREYGVYGFCFYYYWFDGKRLLEKPLEAMLRSGTPDFPFCICWANENWTRTWDGKDTEVIIGQEHAPKSDLEFIYDILPMLRDSRYIRVDGKPLIAVYRTGLLPDTAATAAAWRKVCRDEGLGEIHLVAVRSFDKRDPRDDGFDAAIQFPPLQIPARNLAAEGTVATKKGFQGFVYDYEDAIRFSLREKSGGFPMYRGVMPAWDNTARRMERGSSWVNATPEKYGQWLREAAQLTVMEQPREQRLVFINAWNEWAEGTHLEPDERHGYALLEETAAAVGRYPTRSGTSNDQPILVISHDAHLAGAQMVTLATVRHWKQNNVPNVRIVCIGGGVLRPAFAAAYPTTVLEDLPTEEARRHAVEAAANFGGRPPSVVYSSTVINGPVLEWIKHLGMPVVTHVHELQNSIERWAPGEIMAATLRATDLFMAASPAICENLVARHGVDPSLARVVPAHIDCDVQAPAAAEVSHVRHSWQAGPTDIVVFGCGTTDWRKGPDLFCEIAVRASSVVPGLRFAWAGGDADYYREWLAARGLANTVHFLGTRGDVRNLLHAADIFLLSSREDPMPLVALEAAAASLPVVCFAGSGDIPSFVGNDAGMVVPPGDITAAAEAIVALARDPVRRHSLGRAGSDRVRATYDSRGVAGETLRLLHRAADGDRRWPVQSRPPLASVIVPNYQHAAYLPERLQSILAQDIGDIEIILLDDSSTDGSLELLEDFARSEPRARIVASETNSGSAFRQWRKGLSMAKGRYVWVAESDDSARSGLLRTLIESLESHPTAVLAYCQSEMIDERGGSLGLPLEWTADISPHRWLTPYMTAGCDEIATALIHKNTIPNVSAVLFRNTPHLPGVINEGMRLCGDWLAYVQLCGHGDVIYTPEPLNLWRQRTSHSRSRPAGELEWDEGRLVIRAAAAILGLDEAATRARLAAFRRRCRGWLAAAGGEVELV